MTIDEIASKPDRYDLDEISTARFLHENAFRCYHVLTRLKKMIREDTPPAMLKDFLNDMADAIGRVELTKSSPSPSPPSPEDTEP